MVSFVKAHVPKGVCPLAGNSIYSDKKFLEKYMPGFMAHLHYRIVDVSTVKELCRWVELGKRCVNLRMCMDECKERTR